MLFQRDHRAGSEEKQRLYATLELLYTAVDFGAAACFVVGSVMFLYPSLQLPGTWLFIVGSFLFSAKPMIRLGREIKLAAMGDESDLARRARPDLDH